MESEKTEIEQKITSSWQKAEKFKIDAKKAKKIYSSKKFNFLSLPCIF
jgi:leucyl-tRNA synthetase